MNNEEEASDDLVSILGGESTQMSRVDIRRYVATYDGNSSDEDEETEESKAEQINITENAEQDELESENFDAEYLPLVEDEFGDFVCGDSIENKTENITFQSSQEATITVNEESINNAIQEVRISVPPLTADKINIIKAAMSKITIKNPNAGAVSIADAIERQQLRLGDEIWN